jgi:hypothetical protein
MTLIKTKKDKQNISVFLTTSTYQNILSAAIALNKNCETILISQRSFEDKSITDTLFELPDVPFDSFIRLPKAENQHRLRNYISNSYSAYKMYALCSSTNVNEVYTTHASPAAQVLLQEVSGDRIYLEDGTATYHTMEQPVNQTQIKYYLSKIIYGPWWCGHYSQATHPQFSKIAATYPTYISEDKNHLTPEKIYSNELRSFLYKWAKSYFKSVNKFEDIQEIDTLYIIPHSESLERIGIDEEELNTIIKNSADESKKIGIKYHPRDENIQISISSEMIEVPRSAPAELLYNEEFKLSKVVGGISTALMSAKWLLPSIDVSTYARISALKSKSIYNLFKEIGIDDSCSSVGDC